MVTRLLILIFIIILSSCQNEANRTAELRAQLQGKWMTSKAYRQGKNTRLLNDFYMVFDSAQVKLNLPAELSVPWQVDHDTLLMNEHPFQKLVLHELTDSTLKVSFDYNRFMYWVELDKEEEIQ